MSRRITRLSLLSVLFLSSKLWAIGLGDINLDSALNEPLRAEIVLLSASPDELSDLTVAMASGDTFDRYGIERPFYLQELEFKVVDNGANGSVVQIRSRSPITEPFLTFLVEATWSSGRLLREYTVLLDPPTYVAPAVQQAPAIEAPRRSTATDSARIERPAEQPAAQPRQSRPVTPPQSNTPAERPVEQRPMDEVDGFSTASGGDLVVARGDTLWGLAARNRPDSRLSMNQMMLAIYEDNPGAFGGNINLLRAGATVRLPSADDVFQISRGGANSEVQRQNDAWGGTSSSDTAADVYADTSSSDDAASDSTSGTATDSTYDAGADSAPETRPNLVLVPPDEEPAGTDYSDDTALDQPQTREQEIESRIAELEGADVPNQQSLIEIRDNELATLRQELAEMRGEVYEPAVDDAADDAMIDDAFVDEIGADDAAVDDILADDAATDTSADDIADAVDASNTIVTSAASSDDKGIVDTIIGFLTGFWGIIIGALILVAGGLMWFLKRGGDDDDDDDRPWETLDSDEMAAGTISATTTMQAPSAEESIVVVEQDSGVHPILEDTVEAPAADLTAGEGSASGSFGSLEDTFSSETAVNLDQTDPIAEADFHMAYGLYDQAADLINGALESDPSDKSLMSKLCEIYFVWGNRDAFVDAATRLKMNIGDTDNADWDKIVIMGQQIAADDDMFAGADIAGVTKAVDVSFEDEGGQAGALDMDFGAEDSAADDVIDLGADDGGDSATQGVDFNFDDPAEQSSVDFDLDVTAETPTIESTMTDATAEMPAIGGTPTIEEQFEGFGDGTSELPSLDEESLSQAIADIGQDADETAEINLDDLDLDIGGISDTEVASLDDLDATGQNEALSDTGINEALADLDLSDVTGKNPTMSADDTGIREGFDATATGIVEGLDLSDLEDSGARFAADETGQNPIMSAASEQDPTDVGIDENLLDATGHTQILSEDMAVETAADLAGQLSDSDATMLAPSFGDDDTLASLADEEPETMLAPLDDDDNFDFAKTEALPPEAFTGNMDLEATAETPAVAETDVDLDLDDLTAALQVSEIGDTIEQPRDDATVEQPRPRMPEETAEVPTMSLAPEDMSSDLHEARTMTEVGTKLDLARAYVDMGDPAGARSILEEVLDEGDAGQKQQAQQLLDSLPS